MGTIIQATALYSDSTPEESVVCSARAAERCLEAAGLERDDVELLVNTGVYRERNTVEPALATLIQKRLGANKDPPLNAQGNRTFSFDLLNGPSAFLNAIEVAGAMLKNRRFKNALIVSSDVHPSVKVIPDSPFAQVGSAVLLRHTDNENEGFKKLAFKTTSMTDFGFRFYVALRQAGREGRHSLTIKTVSDYVKRLRDFAAQTANEFLRANAVGKSDITHIVCSLPTPSFAHEVAEALSLSSRLVVSEYRDFGDAHSSSLAASYHAAKSRRLFHQGDKILFISAGAGLTCGCALYYV